MENKIVKTKRTALKPYLTRMIFSKLLENGTKLTHGLKSKAAKTEQFGATCDM